MFREWFRPLAETVFWTIKDTVEKGVGLWRHGQVQGLKV